MAKNKSRTAHEAHAQRLYPKHPSANLLTHVPITKTVEKRQTVVTRQVEPAASQAVAATGVGRAKTSPGPTLTRRYDNRPAPGATLPRK